MSSVRMCDRCGKVFSELEDGWQTFTATTMKRNAEGARVSVPAALDACPSCALGETPVVSQRLALESARDDYAGGRISEAELEQRTGAALEREPVYAGDRLVSPPPAAPPTPPLPAPPEPAA